MVFANRKARDAVHRVRNDAGALRKLSHHQPLRRDLAAEAGADLAFSLGMELQG
jgi:hypothetical protein